MKHLLLTTIAAVLVVGCGPSVDIWEAATIGDIEAVKQHLAYGSDVNAKGGQFEGTPLHYATSQGHKEVTELLINKGADVNAKVDQLFDNCNVAQKARTVLMADAVNFMAALVTRSAAWPSG